MSHDAPQAGWYPNPDGTGGLRWWSGVGWTEYTRPNPEAAQNTEVLGTPEPTAVLDAPEPTAVLDTGEPTAVLDTPPPTTVLPDQPSTQQPVPQSAWGQPGGGPPPPAQYPAHPAYIPPAASPLTPSGMRPLGGMFGDIGRITRRAWLPILVISAIIWGAVSVVLGLVTVAFVDTGALRRGLDQLGAALEANPEGDFTSSQADAITSAFSTAFDSLPVAGWILLGLTLGVLLLLASTVQVGAVNRLAMDAASYRKVSWAAAWRSGFVAGLRLFGYYLLLMLLITFVVMAITVVIAVVAQFAPALAAGLGLLAFFGFIVGAFWLTGRLIPALAQAVVSGRALSWSWRATKGKFWAVLGRYLLWSLAASVIINVISTFVSIPVSALFLGEATSASSPGASLGLALTLNLLLLPFTMAMAAITMVGVVPIWRDLTDHPDYRSIDANGVPVTLVEQPGSQ